MTESSDAEGDARDRLGHLARHELGPAARRLVVEEDARRRMHAVRLAVVDGHVVAEHLRHAVGGARPQEGVLALRDGLHLAEHLRARGLVEAHLRRVVVGVQADRLEGVQDAAAGHVRGEGGILPRVGDERDGAEVVDLVGLRDLEGAHEARQVREVTGEELHAGNGVLDESPLRVVLPAHEAVDLVALREQELRKVEAVLAGDSGDECSRHVLVCFLLVVDCQRPV